MFKTPILFIIFNRPEVTKKVFEEIRKQRPKYLYVVADGPRPNVPEDIEQCKATRKIIIENLDWNCELKTLFRDQNLGCGKGVSSGITWFFENVEEGIILEDDCLPHPDFFNFCVELLEKYRYNPKIYAITGDNFQKGIKRGGASYYFSQYMFVWGWASWRRAWKNYDFEMKGLKVKENEDVLKVVTGEKHFVNHWRSTFEKVANGEIDTWDYQWLYSIWKNKALTVVPNVNLISNIGFGEAATHTKDEGPLANLATNEMGIIDHPNQIKIEKEADRFITSQIYQIKNPKNAGSNLMVFFSKLFKSRTRSRLFR